MPKVYLILGIIIASCSTTMDQEKFLSTIGGKYSLTKAGKEFIIRDMSNTVTEPVNIDDTLEIKNKKIILVTQNKTEIELALFNKMQLDKAIFELSANKEYIAVGIFEKKLLLATTNSTPNPNSVLSEMLVTIARKDDK